ncbi:MAG: hypothetical protein J5I98_18550 [Phaeodactylibacter sp.]|nr:hypothetical protein [Phaeodactylibacter sp.]
MAFLPLRLSYAMLLLLSACAVAGAQRPSIEDFTLSGDTYRTEDDCFRLTEEEDYSSGSIWYRRPISLSAPFSIELSILAGCKDGDGADGMVFVFTTQANRVGYRGEGIGFGGLQPSIGIEVDTWLNYHLNDPREDHVAIMANGQVGHYNDLAGPVAIPNIEDCRRHQLAIRWDPGTQRLSVEIDKQEVIAARADLINAIFQGNDVVYWGVTAATGRYNNFHEVCFDRLSMAPPMEGKWWLPVEMPEELWVEEEGWRGDNGGKSGRYW